MYLIQILKIEHPLNLTVTNKNHIFKFWELLNLSKIQWIIRCLDFRYHLFDYLNIIRFFEPFSHYQRLDPNLLQAVLELALLERGVNIDQNKISACRREL